MSNRKTEIACRRIYDKSINKTKTKSKCLNRVLKDDQITKGRSGKFKENLKKMVSEMEITERDKSPKKNPPPNSRSLK